MGRAEQTRRLEASSSAGRQHGHDKWRQGEQCFSGLDSCSPKVLIFSDLLDRQRTDPELQAAATEVLSQLEKSRCSGFSVGLLQPTIAAGESDKQVPRSLNVRHRSDDDR